MKRSQVKVRYCNDDLERVCPLKWSAWDKDGGRS